MRSGTGRRYGGRSTFPRSESLGMPTSRMTAPEAHLRPSVVHTTEGLASLAPAWDELRESLDASPFAGPALYRAWLAERGRRVRPLVVAVHDGEGRLRAVAPLVRRGPLAYSLPG